MNSTIAIREDNTSDIIIDEVEVRGNNSKKLKAIDPENISLPSSSNSEGDEQSPVRKRKESVTVRVHRINNEILALEKKIESIESPKRRSTFSRKPKLTAEAKVGLENLKQALEEKKEAQSRIYTRLTKLSRRVTTTQNNQDGSSTVTVDEREVLPLELFPNTNTEVEIFQGIAGITPLQTDEEQNLIYSTPTRPNTVATINKDRSILREDPNRPLTRSENKAPNLTKADTLLPSEQAELEFYRNTVDEFRANEEKRVQDSLLLKERLDNSRIETAANKLEIESLQKQVTFAEAKNQLNENEIELLKAENQRKDQTIGQKSQRISELLQETNTIDIDLATKAVELENRITQLESELSNNQIKADQEIKALKLTAINCQTDNDKQTHEIRTRALKERNDLETKVATHNKTIKELEASKTQETNILVENLRQAEEENKQLRNTNKEYYTQGTKLEVTLKDTQRNLEKKEEERSKLFVLLQQAQTKISVATQETKSAEEELQLVRERASNELEEQINANKEAYTKQREKDLAKNQQALRQAQEEYDRRLNQTSKPSPQPFALGMENPFAIKSNPIATQINTMSPRDQDTSEINELISVPIRQSISKYHGFQSGDKGDKVESSFMEAERTARGSNWSNEQMRRYFPERFRHLAESYHETIRKKPEYAGYKEWKKAIIDRFTDPTQPETHRKELNDIKQKDEERVRDFKSRIERLFRKGYGEEAADAADPGTVAIREITLRRAFQDGLNEHLQQGYWNRITSDATFEEAVKIAADVETIEAKRKKSSQINSINEMINNSQLELKNDVNLIAEQLQELKLSQAINAVTVSAIQEARARSAEPNRYQDKDCQSRNTSRNENNSASRNSERSQNRPEYRQTSQNRYNTRYDNNYRNQTSNYKPSVSFDKTANGPLGQTQSQYKPQPNWGERNKYDTKEDRPYQRRENNHIGGPRYNREQRTNDKGKSCFKCGSQFHLQAQCRVTGTSFTGRRKENTESTWRPRPKWNN